MNGAVQLIILYGVNQTKSIQVTKADCTINFFLSNPHIRINYEQSRRRKEVK